MDKLKKIVEEYNKRQDELFAELLDTDNILIEISSKKGHISCVGFYEWLWNSEYKVFKVFKIPYGFIQMITRSAGNENILMIDKSMQEIIDYIYKQLED